MKKLLFAAIALLFALGCSNDFDLTDDWKDIPVVYAFLQQTDANHYVRVEKAFLDPRTSALVVAKNADSLYYKDAAVFLARGSDGKRFPLERVDGDAEGIPRDTGIFAESPNILYKLSQSVINLKAGEKCRLIIERGDGLPEVTAETTILGKLELRSPMQAITGVTFKSGSQFRFRWSAPPEAQIFDISATIRVREDRGGTITTDTLYWTIVRNVKRPSNQPTGDVVGEVAAAAFYKFLADNLQPDPTVNRYITSTGIDFRIDGGGFEINEYNDVLDANSGISGAELVPIYTNLSEGFGLFTSRGFVIEAKFGPSPATNDSLELGQYTKHLGFKG